MGPKPTKEDNTSPTEPTTQDEYTSSRKGKFRFKSSRSRTKHKRERDDDLEPHSHHRRHHHHHRKRHRHRDDDGSGHRSRSSKKRTRSASPQNHDDEDNNGNLSPDTAFRESLFDALGDDEGAEYWQAIYGQPIHTYANPSVPRGPDGELEQMSEEEYAAYVRTRMWERTREGMLEAQEKLRDERREKEKRERKEREWTEGRRERERFEKAMEESLRRGRERKRGKAWKGLGEGYLKRWKEVDALRGNGNGGGKVFEELVFWPVESGKRRGVSREAVEEFLRHALVPASASASGKEDDLLAVLKSERVRWHPDKIQHRYGVLGIDDAVMRSVTEVFQIVDHLWNELKEKKG